MNNPHDALFRGAFSAPERATDLLQLMLPAEGQEDIDWSTLRLVDGTFIDAQLGRRHTDLLFSVRLRGRPTCFYVLFEHRSYGDRLLALTLAEYVVRVQRHLAAEHPGRLLPPVLPLVMQHGSGVRGPNRLRDLVDCSGVPRHLMWGHLDMTFRFQDLSTMATEEIYAWRARADTRLALLHLRQVAAEPSTARLLLSWADLFREVAEDPGADRLLEQLLSYVVTLSREDRSTLLAAYAAIHPMTKELFMPLADKLRQEGRQEGRQETLRSTLRMLLEERFGPLPAPVQNRVGTAEDEELESLIRQTLTAQSLEQLFG